MSLTYTEIAEICHEIVNLSELKFDRLKGFLLIMIYKPQWIMNLILKQ